MTQIQHKEALDSLSELLAELDKTGEESNTEAGGFDGSTEHPTKKEDDSTENAYVGSRARENEQDIDKDQGEAGVDGESSEKSAADTITHDQDGVQLNIGTKQRATGEDPENETSRAGDTHEDKDYENNTSSHPARSDNNEIDGHKWASEIGKVRDLIKIATEKGNDCLGALSTEFHGIQQRKGAATSKSAMQCKTCGKDPCTCEKTAGAQLADAALDQGEVDGQDKQAQDAAVVDMVAASILSGWSAAEKTAEFIRVFNETRDETTGMTSKKAATGEPRRTGSQKTGEEEVDPESNGGGESSESSESNDEENGEMPPGEPSAEQAATEPPPPEEGGEDELMAALTQEPPEMGAGLGDAVGGGAVGEMGPGMPQPGEIVGEGAGGAEGAIGAPEELMGGEGAGAEGAGLGGAEGGLGGLGGAEGAGLAGAGAPAGGAEMPAAEELALLAAALQEAGITPEQLQMAASNKMAAITPQQLQASAEAETASILAKAAQELPQSTKKDPWRPKNAEEAKQLQQMVKTIKEIANVR